MESQMACGSFCGAQAANLAAQNRLGQRLEIVLRSGKQQLRKPLITQHIEDEAGQNQRGQNGSSVEDAAQALPTLALGIEKYLTFGHE